MPSPFPGMDPYLEDPAVWPGVHDRLIIYIADALQPMLIPRYYVEVRERIYFTDLQDIIYPDITLLRRPSAPAAPSGGVAILTADEPTILAIETRQRETFLEIRAVGSHEVVTVIEVISPSNKAGGGREEYLRKQREVLDSTAHLVEIDLLRRGAPVVAAPADLLAAIPRYDYLACVRRATRPGRVAVYGVTVRERLPRLAIPLREPDADVVLDLPAIFARCYDNGAYTARIDYNRPPPEPLRPEDAEWADALLRASGLRGQSAP